MESAQWIPYHITYKEKVLYSVILYTKPLIPASVVRIFFFCAGRKRNLIFTKLNLNLYQNLSLDQQPFGA